MNISSASRTFTFYIQITTIPFYTKKWEQGYQPAAAAEVTEACNTDASDGGGEVTEACITEASDGGEVFPLTTGEGGCDAK